MKSRTLIIFGAAILAFSTAGCSSNDPTASQTASEPTTVTSSPVSKAESITPTATAPTTSGPDVFQIGETISTDDMEITVNSIESVDTTQGNNGETLRPSVDGRKLLLVHTTFTNKGTDSLDLTCAGLPNWYIEAFDTSNNKLAAFEGSYNIPGNPECNAQLLNGETTNWTMGFEMPSTSIPGYLTFTDTSSFSYVFVISFDPQLQFETE